MSDRDSRIVASVTQEAADWHARLRAESLSEVEEVRFRAWLAGDPARRREFDAMSALWDNLDKVAQAPEILAERQQSAQPARVSRRAVAGWALAAGVAGLAGFLSWQHFVAIDTYSTALGEQRSVPLADGSVVTLNTSSEVKVRFSAKLRRIEIVRGQASFEVAKDTARPFLVQAGTGEVRALGTEFDVYRRADGNVVVTLLEGRVAVTPAASAPIVLNAGEQVSFGVPGQAVERRHADLQQAAAWRNRKLVFAETPVAEAIAEANRYSRVQIELRAPELADAKISGTFEAGRTELLAEGLQAFLGLSAERTEDQRIVLSPAHGR